MATPSCAIPQLNDGSFGETASASSFPVLVYFTRQGCEGCQLGTWRLRGVMGKSNSPINCFCLHGPKSPKVTARYRVEQYPTILVFREGRVVRRLVGHPLQEELEFILRTELP